MIQRLQTIPELGDFVLVGGTSLALQMGHRNSIDIDLFSQNEFTANQIEEVLSRNFTFKANLFKNNTILAEIDSVKTDFIRHNYPYILPPITEEGITFLSKEEISAMKLYAIIQRGKRLKDFIDIYYLLEHFSMNRMVQFFAQKYFYANPMIALKAVTFFDEIDPNIHPPKLLKPLKLEAIRKRILLAAQKPNIIF